MDEITKMKGEIEHLKKVVKMLVRQMAANDKMIYAE
tara:strand:+ start:2389 stop:2496 length:108 start_codon:yes stop_codon:yes gene_type:complete